MDITVNRLLALASHFANTSLLFGDQLLTARLLANPWLYFHRQPYCLLVDYLVMLYTLESNNLIQANSVPRFMT